jgi:acid phosphatase (class A)
MQRIASLILGLVIASLLEPQPARAQDNLMKPAAGAPAAAHFISPGTIDLPRVVPAPPAPGSLGASADLAVVLQAQAWRTPEQIAWAKVVEKQTIVTLYGDLFGPWFTAENLPTVMKLMTDVADDVRPISEAAKKQYSRARPYVVDSRVKPCVEAPVNDSYPSGHALAEYLMAGFLTEIHPDRQADLFERAQRAAWGRIIGGVHFPTDLEGGRRLAAAVLVELKKSPAFRAALEKCRAELATAARKKAA